MNFLYKYLIYVLFIFIKVKDNEALRCYVCKDCTEISEDYIQTCGINLSPSTSVPSTTLIEDTTTTNEELEITTDENEAVIVVTTPENVATMTENVLTTVESIDSTSQSPIETTSSSTENLVSTTEVATEETTEDATEGTTQGITQEATKTVTEGTTEGTTQETTQGITEEITERTTLETTEKVTEETAEEITTEETTEITIQETTDTVTEGTTEGITEEITEGTTYETAETTTEEITQETTASTTDLTMVTEDTEGTTVVTSEEEPFLISEARPLQGVLSSFEPETIRTRKSLVSRGAQTFVVRETTNKINKENTQTMMVNNLTENQLQFPANSRKFRSAIFSFRSTLRRNTSDELEPRCIVVYYTENDETKVIRGCSFKSDDANARCREAIGDGFDGDISKCKLCDTDLCNSVSPPVVQLALIFICTVIVTSF